MGLGLETIDTYVAAAAATGYQTLAPGPNQTLAVRASNGQARIHLDTIAPACTVSAVTSIRSPRLHDVSQGILVQGFAGVATEAADEYFDQTLYSQDILAVLQNYIAAPAAGALQRATLEVYYEDLPGINASLRTWAEVQPNVLEYVGIQCTPTSAAVSGSWGTGVALNSTYDLLKANQLYAILGFSGAPGVVAVAVQGPDTGNLLCGGPVDTYGLTSRRWFAEQAVRTGRPYIPIINSANKASTLVNITATVAATAIPVVLLAARLSA
jgi:hypothetical protein